MSRFKSFYKLTFIPSATLHNDTLIQGGKQCSETEKHLSSDIRRTDLIIFFMIKTYHKTSSNLLSCAFIIFIFEMTTECSLQQFQRISGWSAKPIDAKPNLLFHKLKHGRNKICCQNSQKIFQVKVLLSLSYMLHSLQIQNQTRLAPGRDWTGSSYS